MCPRCENEELKGTENYCPICGLKLKQKAVQEINTPEQAIIYVDLDEKLVKKIIREIIEIDFMARRLLRWLQILYLIQVKE